MSCTIVAMLRLFGVVALMAMVLQTSSTFAEPLNLVQLKRHGLAAANRPVESGNASSQRLPVKSRRAVQHSTRAPEAVHSSGGRQARQAHAKQNKGTAGGATSASSSNPLAPIKKDRRIVASGLPALLQGTSVSPELGASAPTQAAEAAVKPGSEANSPLRGDTHRPSDRVGSPGKCDLGDAMKKRVDEVIARFCSTNGASLEQARLAWQTKELESLGRNVQEATAELDKKLGELKSLRDAIAKMREQQNEKVVTIFAEMRPDAAAQQLSSMSQPDAVGILSGMLPKTASLILNEMPPKQAALLSGAMLANKDRGKPYATSPQN
jgi:flagellar motility protein MotE (MotC chaperone)